MVCPFICPSLDVVPLSGGGSAPHPVALVERESVLETLLGHRALRAEPLGPPHLHRGQRGAMSLRAVTLLLTEEDLLGQVRAPGVGLPLG